MKLVASYKRNGATYDGTVSTFDGAMEVGMHASFFSFGFHELIMSLHGRLADMPEDTELVFQRTERPGLMPVTLDEETVRLIREDPLEAIRAMSPDPVTVHVRDKQVEMGPPMRKAIRAGHDTMADCFGDDIYIKRAGGKVESPYDGRWVELKEHEDMVWFDSCGVTMAPDKVSGDWVVIPTKQLIRTGEEFEKKQERYYLPRLWNKTGPWITHVDLKEKYETYLKEKDQCLETTKTH